MARVRYQWIVRYQRENWKYAQVRHFVTRGPADRLIAKLLGEAWNWAHLSPLVFIKLSRRPLGEEEFLYNFTPNRKPWRIRR